MIAKRIPMDKATLHFILEHANSDVHSLMLQAAKFPEVDMPLAVRQITGMQKVKNKIPTFYACKNLLYPVKLSLEQSSSEITAKHKSALCEGNVLADLTGGFGVDAYFFSFRFDNIIYVEKDPELCRLAEHNFKALNRKNITVINDTAENFLKKTDSVSWIFLDPARRTKSGKKAVLFSDCEPNTVNLADELLSKTGHVMVKLSPMIDISVLCRELRNITEIQIVAVENECKEVIAILTDKASDAISIKTIHFPNSKPAETLDFDLNDEHNAVVRYADEVKTYLYEPNAAVLKSGAFKLTGERFGIDKLHINSHLYTSDRMDSDFPGRIFLVEKVYDFSKNSLKELQAEVKKSNITVRNFPVSVNELRKKLKISEGGYIYLFATTLKDGKKVLICCRKAK